MRIFDEGTELAYFIWLNPKFYLPLDKVFSRAVATAQQNGIGAENFLLLRESGVVNRIGFDRRMRLSYMTPTVWSLVEDFQYGYRIKHENGTTLPDESSMPNRAGMPSDYPTLRESQERLDEIVASGPTLFLVENTLPMHSFAVYQRRYDLRPAFLSLHQEEGIQKTYSANNYEPPKLKIIGM